MRKAMTLKANIETAARRGHAVVAGAGVAGLLAASVLATFFERVSIVERDSANPGSNPGTNPRRGVPQGRHAHALLPRGLAALERLLPGFAETAIAHGAVGANAASDVSWGLGGIRLAAASDTLPVIVSTRPFLENEIRRRVTMLANVAFVVGARVSDFVLQGDRVTGVVLEHDPGGTTQRLQAELVIDAMGRASRLPAWLAAHGFAAPREEIMEVDVGYATARYAADPDRLGGRRAVLVGATPQCSRGGVMHAVEGGTIEISLTGYRDQHPPATREGFVAHAASLALPDIHRLIHDAEPCSEIATFRVGRTVRRHYQKLARLPSGLLAMGDAVCAFNPVFAQGMTVATLEAAALHDMLQDALQQAGSRPLDNAFVRGFYRRAAAALEPAWQMARGNDLLVPHLAHHASLPDRLMSRWIGRVLAAGARDPEVARRFIRVASLIDAPSALLAPALVARAVWAGTRPSLTH
jgi:2-polyprenyl-6-methoxyphenol hydroxylase-like FAD-dependent oxidoreductase